MGEGILIATSPGREDWVLECMRTIDRPLIVCSTWGYELGKIKWAYENTNWDRFVFLQDSIVITDNTVFDRIWETPGSICLHHERNHYSCYLGVYERKILDRIDIPTTNTKQGSVECEEAWASKVYAANTEELTCFDSHEDGKFKGTFGPIFDYHGRMTLPYTNDFLIKYRGDFGQRTIAGGDPEDRKLK